MHTLNSGKLSFLSLKFLMTPSPSCLSLGRFELAKLQIPQEEVIMRKSSSFNPSSVKLNAKQREALVDVLKPNIKEIVREGVDQFVGNGTRVLLEILMHAEANEHCGKRHSRSEGRKAVRWGSEQGTALIDGAKRAIDRPRIRVKRGVDEAGGEIALETYKAMNRSELLDGPLVATILSGVSARQYAKIVSRGLEAKGIRKSAVSRKTIAATKPTVEQFRKSSLKEHELVVLIFDGVSVGKRQVIACIGIDVNGQKSVLGLRVGATENEIVCRDLIRDLIERGLNSSAPCLFVVDGSKALIGAIRAAFGQDVAIQRCQEHKIRDVQGYLPVRLRAEFRDKLQAAYNQRSESAALKRLDRIRLELSLISDNAVNALTEGMTETVTLHRLGITGLLRQSLRTTNIIESAFSSVRRYMGRVSNFHDEAQRELWITRSLLEAEKHFRRLRGSRQLRKLRDSLEYTAQGGHHA
jgi:transposase-like protein